MNLKLSPTLREFFFSQKCILCGKENTEDKEYVCEECRKKLEKKKQLRVRKNIYYLFNYTDDVRKLLINYKLKERKNTAFYLSSLIEEDLKKIINENKIDIVIPVPISRERYLLRGFNQVNFLLDIIGINYKILEREKNTIPMYKFTDENLRRINIKSAFKINFITKDKNILIVDDIITTGTTVSEIAKVLNITGKPKNIFVFAVTSAAEKFKNV